jgi:hypothetical protein
LPEGIGRTLYDGSLTFFLDPGLRLSAGLALDNGIEFWGHFGIIPQPVADAVGGLAEIEGLVLNRFNAGGRVRVVLVKDQPGLPAVSLGAGYTYTQFNLGLENLGALVPAIDLAGFSAGLTGRLYAQTRLHTAGVDLGLSKKLAVFAPFLRMGAWYQWASYEAGIEGLGVTLSDDNPATADTAVTGTDPKATLSIHDLSFLLAGGVELVLGKFSTILEGGYNTATGAPSANVSFQFRI